MSIQPRERLRAVAFHRNLGQNLVVLHIEVANPAIRQDDVGIQDLTGHWMNTARTNGGADIVVQPTHEVVANIFGVFLHVIRKDRWIGILLIDNNRVSQADFFERFVPKQNALLNPMAITLGCGVFDVENDRLFRWAHLERRIGFLKVPAIDETNLGFIIAIFAEVRIAGCKEANSFVRFAGFVAGAGWYFADRVVKRL